MCKFKIYVSKIKNAVKVFTESWNLTARKVCLLQVTGNGIIAAQRNDISKFNISKRRNSKLVAKNQK